MWELGNTNYDIRDNYMYSGEKYAYYYTFLLFVLLDVQVTGCFLFFLLPYILFIHFV